MAARVLGMMTGSDGPARRAAPAATNVRAARANLSWGDEIGVGTPAGATPSVSELSVERLRFERIFADHADAVLAYALRRSASRDDAADTLSETMLVAWRRLDDVPDGDGVRPWLYAVARRVLANQRRSLRRLFRLGDRLRLEIDHGIAPAQPEGFGRAAEIRAVLEQLSEGDQELLRLSAWEHLSGPELAAALDIGHETARSRLYRARARFRDALLGPDSQRTTSGEGDDS